MFEGSDPRDGLGISGGVLFDGMTRPLLAGSLQPKRLSTLKAELKPSRAVNDRGHSRFRHYS